MKYLSRLVLVILVAGLTSCAKPKFKQGDMVRWKLNPDISGMVIYFCNGTSGVTYQVRNINGHLYDYNEVELEGLPQ